MSSEESRPLQRKFVKKKQSKETQKKYAAIVVVGILNCLYSFTEVGFALYVDSIALLSDGIHNISDVISLIIAFWALYKSSNENTSVSMTYGWKRTEILGAVMNGCFLVSLCTYIVLEAIPKIIKNPTPLDSSWYFIGIAASGFVVNTIGTILFSLISGGHGHVHAGGGKHGHGHGSKSKHGHDEEHDHDHANGQKKHGHDEEHDHDHAHGHGKKNKDKNNQGKKSKHDHDHDHDNGDHEHGHGKKNKDKNDHGDEQDNGDHGHGKKKKDDHDHGDEQDNGDHGHGHGHGKKKKDNHDHADEQDNGDHGHGNGKKNKDKNNRGDEQDNGDHGHGKKKKDNHDHADEHEHDHGHGHGKKKKDNHDHGDEHEHEHDHGHGKKKKNKDKHDHGDEHYHEAINSNSLEQETPDDDKNVETIEESYENKESEHKDHNMYAVFLHFLGDAFSSLLVLAAGLLSKYFPNEKWTLYLDPVSSLLIVLLILWTTLPLIFECSRILLQKAPSHLHIPSLKGKLLKITGVRGIHDLHVWELNDSLSIASLHAVVQEKNEKSTKSIIAKIKDEMHRNGIHSSTLQIEYLGNTPDKACKQFCVEECSEEWCCKDQDGSVSLDIDSYTF